MEKHEHKNPTESCTDCPEITMPNPTNNKKEECCKSCTTINEQGVIKQTLECIDRGCPCHQKFKIPFGYSVPETYTSGIGKTEECCYRCYTGSENFPNGCINSICSCHQKEEVREGWEEQIFTILETYYGHIEENARKELEVLFAQQIEAGAEAERARIVEEVEKARTQFAKVENREVIINYIIKLISNKK